MCTSKIVQRKIAKIYAAFHSVSYGVGRHAPQQIGSSRTRPQPRGQYRTEAPKSERSYKYGPCVSNLHSLKSALDRMSLNINHKWAGRMLLLGMCFKPASILYTVNTHHIHCNIEYYDTYSEILQDQKFEVQADEIFQQVYLKFPKHANKIERIMNF